MTIKSLGELGKADERTLRFIAGGGFGLDVAMDPEDSARHWQEVAAGVELHASVAETTRRSFDHLRTVFAYGVLCYEIFTLVHDHALLILEQALRDRFVSYNSGTVTFVRGSNTTEVSFRGYQDILEFVRKGKTPRLVVCPAGEPEYLQFNGMLASLLSWARKEDLLRGGRNRLIEAALKDMRDAVAHPDGYQLLMPVDAARTLKDLAEIINRLWGYDTPGGRLYPAPLIRRTVVLAWEPGAGLFACALATRLKVEGEWDSYSKFAIVQAVWDDAKGQLGPQLEDYDSLFETTAYPTDYLWGPGSRVHALEWIEHRPPNVDSCDPIDRLFAVRVEAGRVWRPMRPEATQASISSTDSDWYLVRADQPDHAFIHVRNVAGRQGLCVPDGPCPACLAEGVTIGSLAEITRHAGVPVGHLPARPDFAVVGPGLHVRSMPL